MAYRSLINYLPQPTNDSSSEENSEDDYDFQDQLREQDPLIWMATNNGNRRPFHNLYPFHLDYSKSGKNYWKCDKCKEGCKARLHTISATNELLRFIGHSIHQAHNHSVDSVALPLAQVKLSLSEMTRKRVKDMSNMAICDQLLSAYDLSPQRNYVDKPMKEKRRRAKINSCLDELKELLFQGNLVNSAKLEKADVLQMAVIRMTELQQENTRLLQEVQQLPQTNKEQAYLDAVQEGLSVFSTATSDALSRMHMPVPLNAAVYRKMLHDEVIGRLNTHIGRQFKLPLNISINDSWSLPSFSESIAVGQQNTPHPLLNETTISHGTAYNSFQCPPESAISHLPLQTQLPFQTWSDPQYDHLTHLSIISPTRPTTTFQSVPSTCPIFDQMQYLQTPPGSLFSGSSTDSILPAPMIPPSSRANVATSNDYLIGARQNNYPQAMFSCTQKGTDAGNMVVPNDYSCISRQSLKRKAVDLSSVQKLTKKKQRKAITKSSPKKLRQSQKPKKTNCKCHSM